MKLFELFATLGLDTKPFDRGSDTAVEKGKKLGENITSNLSTKAVYWGNLLNDVTKNVVKTFTEIAIESLNVGAEMEAANAQFEAAFGGLQGVATAAFDAIGKEINVLPSRLKEVGTKGFSQLKGAGLSANEALDESQRLMRLAADAAAYYDISLEAADERLRSFMRGNTEAGDAIGLFTSESQRDSAAVETYGKKWLDLTEAQKQVLMLNIAEEIYKQAGAIGQAERESDSWSNTLANLKEAWRMIVGTFGLPFTDALTPVLEKITTFLTENQDDVEIFSTKVAELVDGALTGLLSAFQWLMDNQDKVSAMLGVAAAGFVAVELAVNPIGTIIASITAAGVALIANWEEVKTKASEIWTSVSEAVTGAWNSITSAIQSSITKVQEFFSIGDASPSYSLGLNESSSIGGGDARPWYVRENAQGRASGLGYVPYDDYAAYLHRGEAVLTRQQAEEYRRNQSGAQPIDTEALAGAIIGALSGLSVTMDGKKVGNIVTEQVSRNIAKKTRAMRGYAT